MTTGFAMDTEPYLFGLGGFSGQWATYGPQPHGQGPACPGPGTPEAGHLLWRVGAGPDDGPYGLWEHRRVFPAHGALLCGGAHRKGDRGGTGGEVVGSIVCGFYSFLFTTFIFYK